MTYHIRTKKGVALCGRSNTEFDIVWWSKPHVWYSAENGKMRPCPHCMWARPAYMWLMLAERTFKRTKKQKQK